TALPAPQDGRAAPRLVPRADSRPGRAPDPPRTSRDRPVWATVPSKCGASFAHAAPRSCQAHAALASAPSGQGLATSRRAAPRLPDRGGNLSRVSRRRPRSAAPPSLPRRDPGGGDPGCAPAGRDTLAIHVGIDLLVHSSPSLPVG